jgi:uncharacterized protein YjbI with pentapeptide repeats
LEVSKLSRRARVAVAVAFGAMTAVAAIAGATAAVADGGCQPGSGPQLAGQHLTAAQVSGFAPGHLRCANLTGADLSGLSLGQVDFTGATMRNANLQHATLDQATLDSADLSGANLTDASMIQVEAKDTKLIGANLSGADLTQADLTGADLSKANLSGTSFIQTTLDDTTFTGATGLAPWDLYIGAAALLFFLLLAWITLRRGMRLRKNAGGFGYSNSVGSNPAMLLLRGLAGAVVVAVGFNLTVGGFIGEILSAAGPPISQTCQGALCTVGVSSGFIGLFGGVILMIAGFVLRSARKSNQPLSASAGFGGGGSIGGTTFGSGGGNLDGTPFS